jgi:hypothetical protein
VAFAWVGTWRMLRGVVGRAFFEGSAEVDIAVPMGIGAFEGVVYVSKDGGDVSRVRRTSGTLRMLNWAI